MSSRQALNFMYKILQNVHVFCIDGNKFYSVLVII
jgi:hypothetical protein